MNFEIDSEIGIAIIAERRIVISIVVRLLDDSWVTCDIAAADPVLDFWNRNKVTKDIDITIVLTDPNSIRNCSRFSLPVTSDPMIAA